MRWKCFKSAWHEAINNRSVVLGIAALFFAAAITVYCAKLPGEFTWGFAAIGVLYTMAFARRVWRVYRREVEYVQMLKARGFRSRA